MNPPASAGGFFCTLGCPWRVSGGASARAVELRLWSSGVPPARRQQGRVESRHTALRSAYRVMAECRRSATMSADVGGDALQRERGGGGPQRGRGDRCATTGEAEWSAGRTRFQLTPDSASGDRGRGRDAPQGGAAVDAVLECVSGGAPRRMCVGACAPDAVGG